MRAPRRPGIYALTFDVVDEYITWFALLGSGVEREYVTVKGGGILHDSRAPHVLNALFLTPQFPGQSVVVLSIQNCGDTAWLKGPLLRGGHVQVAVQRLDVNGRVQHRDWMRVPLPHTVLAGETVVVRLELSKLASHPETAKIKIDLVAEQRCWFEDVGSTPLLLDVRRLS